jgi:PadR family transcriptional regulator
MTRPSGTVHPILGRLDGLGCLLSRWEDHDPHEQGRPRRRYYRLTTDGAEQARAAMAGARTPVSKLLSWGAVTRGEVPIGVFYDGGWFAHVSDYYADHHPWHAPDIAAGPA